MTKAKHLAPPTDNVVIRWGKAYFRFNTAVVEQLIKLAMTRVGALCAMIALGFLSYHVTTTLSNMVYPYVQVPIVILWNVFAIFGYKVLLEQIFMPRKW